MKGKAGLTVVMILLVCAFSSAPGQAPAVLGKQNAFESLYNQRKEDLRRKGLDICFSFDDTGSVSKISIRSNQLDQFGFRSIMKRDTVMKVIDELAPNTERGGKIWEHTTSLGRASGESIGYQKLTINTTMVCRERDCGVSYAEIVWRK